MPIEIPLKKAASKKRSNKTYKKHLTKKQIALRKKKAITILISIAIGVGVISGYGQATERYLEKLNKDSGSVYIIHEAKASPIIEIIDVKSGIIREVTAYNSVEWQTDATPCIAADGTDVCKRYQAGECIVAANFAKLGSKIYIDKIGLCTVADRMASKHSNRVDVFFDKDVDRAIKFGLQRLLVK